VAHQFRRYLLQERGLSTATLQNYVPFIDQFLAERFRNKKLNLSMLRATDVTGFVQRHAHRLSPGRAKLLVTALRSFFRYLRHRGEISLDLAACVPIVPNWSKSTLPKFLPPGTVQRVVDRCDRQEPLGRRNYAILLLLARLGLRAGEVVALNLEDIDWEASQMTVHGKGGRSTPMPLPADVGEAIAAYLRNDRPRCSSRRVFIRAKAPLGGFASSVAISFIVMRALKRAGVDSARKGAHLFRHTLACDLLREGCFKLVKHEAGLEEFASFLERKRSTHITSELALEWATLPAHHQPCQWTARLTIVRGFARYWSAVDPVTEVPPLGLLPYRPTRARPYFYSDQEIQQLLKAAKARPSCDPLRPWTYHCFFGLLAVTGLRLSEAVNLHADDLDWSGGILTIRGAKFGKSRLVPLHASTCKVLAEYAKRRDRRFGPRAEAHFFVNKNGNRLDKGEIHRMFYILSRQIGLRAAGGGRGPRLHDFRHRFALETLLRWYRNGEDPQRRLPILSTYLGHAHVTDTYWYLTGTPELLGAAGKRLEKRWEGLNAGR
jgi:integrase/recombinase XerD